MSKMVTAFFMAWGNFLALPCPYKKWDGELKNRMLAFLPSVGMVAGLLWLGLAVLLAFIRLPGFLIAALLGLFGFGVGGFMHLDGFMDVSDAVLSRKPLEDRRRILKDSRVGAFAVISLAFLLILQFAAMLSTVSTTFTFSGFLPLMTVPVVSRAVAGLAVLSFKPMETSQYAEDHQKPRGVEVGILLVQTALYIGIALVLSWRWDRMGSYGLIRTLIPVAATALGTLGAILYGRGNLAGMNGDIAGYGISIGEVIGIMALAVAY